MMETCPLVHNLYNNLLGLVLEQGRTLIEIETTHNTYNNLTILPTLHTLEIKGFKMLVPY